jgi:hypothetical protein
MLSPHLVKDSQEIHFSKEETMKKSTLNFKALFLVGVIIVVGALVWTGCSDSPVSPTAKNFDGVELSLANPRIAAVAAIQDRHTEQLMANPEVIGTATTIDDDGEPAILVFVTSEKALRGAPMSLEGVRTKVVLTDKIVAMKGGGVSHRAKQTLPIQLGTSGGWRTDLANGFCCGGTLGALIQVGGQQRILSNYHVFEADIVNGGNGITAQTGDFIIQPGLIDINCNAANAQNVATLVKSSSLPGSNVDASSATVISGAVSSTGAILEVGTLTSATIGASVGQAVKKSGRTTGLTRSSVVALNASINIAYENECAGGAAFTKTFTGQIVINNSGSRFLAGGDSGSLMVQDIASNPRAVGLLFAGSSSYAFAMPINEVLSFFGASMVGI